LEKDLKASFDAGANSFLEKSLDFDEFMDKLSAAVHYWTDLNVSPFQAVHGLET
jgi:hypothetical protein